MVCAEGVLAKNILNILLVHALSGQELLEWRALDVFIWDKVRLETLANLSLQCLCLLGRQRQAHVFIKQIQEVLLHLRDDASHVVGSLLLRLSNGRHQEVFNLSNTLIHVGA